MNKQKGFTLIELMIVIAIMGIMAVIAYPNYQNSISKSRRADAKGALTSFANAMERQFTQTGSYCDAGGTGGAAVSNCGTATNDTGSPTIFSTKSPVDGSDTYYNLTISAVSRNTFTLSATPANAQANDKCGILSLTNTGVRDAKVSGTSVNTSQSCW